MKQPEIDLHLKLSFQIYAVVFDHFKVINDRNLPLQHPDLVDLQDVFLFLQLPGYQLQSLLNSGQLISQAFQRIVSLKLLILQASAEIVNLQLLLLPFDGPLPAIVNRNAKPQTGAKSQVMLKLIEVYGIQANIAVSGKLGLVFVFKYLLFRDQLQAVIRVFSLEEQGVFSCY